MKNTSAPKLGDLARDIITGFKGVVIARTEWPTGCDRLTLQPQVLKDGQPYATQTFDVANLETVKADVIKATDVAGTPRNKASEISEKTKHTISDTGIPISKKPLRKQGLN